MTGRLPTYCQVVVAGRRFALRRCQSVQALTTDALNAGGHALCLPRRGKLAGMASKDVVDERNEHEAHRTGPIRLDAAVRGDDTDVAVLGTAAPSLVGTDRPHKRIGLQPRARKPGLTSA